MNQLERKLNRFVRVIIREAEQNERFAAELSRLLDAAQDGTNDDESAPVEAPKKLGRVRAGNRRDPAAFDPVDIMREDSEAELRKALGGLNMDQLKDIIADYSMDSSRLAMRWKNRARLEDLIVTTAARRATKGDAFRNLG